MPWAHGTQVAATRFPRYWDYNTLRLEGPAPTGLTPEKLAAEADRLQPALAHRKVECEDESSGERLTDGLRELGWRVTRLAWMRFEGACVKPLPGVLETSPLPRVLETSPARIRPLRAEWLGAEDLGYPAPGVDAFLSDEQAVASMLPGQLTTFAALDPAGNPAGYCNLRTAGDSGDIEDVYCTPGRRGHGHATALVAAAIARALQAGVRDLFIVADHDDWPKDLYARLGFETAWLRHDAVLRQGTPDRRLVA